MVKMPMKLGLSGMTFSQCDYQPFLSVSYTPQETDN
jgi:hypothetical protein